MRFRKLRIAWSVGWCLAAVLLIALWVRSYWVIDILAGGNHSVASVTGSLYLDETLRFEGPGDKVAWFNSSNTAPYVAVVSQPVKVIPNGSGWRVPLSLAFIANMSVCLVPWLPGQFSLRTLLIATTLVAVMLGLIVWLR